MNRILGAALALVLVAGPCFSQTTPPAAFDAADVHTSPERLHPEIRATFRTGRISLRDATVANLISIGYKVEPTDVIGGPSWLDFDRFDINAQAPSAATYEEATGMLRGLLAERFQLVAHTDKRPLPAFILSVGKLNKMKQASASADPGQCQFQPPPPNTPMPPPGSDPLPIRFSCHNTSMETFAQFLRDVASPYLTRPVLDQTGLKGGWDFDLQWNYNRPKNGGISIFDAVEKQLGLRLESKPVPTPVVTVDSVSEKPTPNVAGIEKILPPAPAAEFEVAVIREANPDEKHFNVEMEGNRVNIHYATLQTLIYTSFQTQPGKIENKPGWLDGVHYDIMGTVASRNSASAAIPGAAPELDMDNVNEMIRSLLADRFKLVTHAGSQPSDVYALVADGPKMKKADATNHPTCKEGPGPDGKDPRIDNPLLSRLISCQNMTMAQFAGELHNFAGGYLPAPVIDSTGLTGAYDFTLSFSKSVDLHKSAGASPASDNGSPSDPGVGGISLFDALQKQLGLKLQKKDKVPMPTLVIDHVEEHPTEN